MKTKLLKKWRNEAVNRIGVFAADDKTYKVVFDKSIFCDVSDYYKNVGFSGFQVVCEGIEDIHEAVKRCDEVRRQFILREARREWNEKMYGAKERVY